MHALKISSDEDRTSRNPSGQDEAEILEVQAPALPERFAQLLRQRKLTAKQVVANAGVNKNTLTSWTRPAPSVRVETVRSVAELLAVPVTDLIGSVHAVDDAEAARQREHREVVAELAALEPDISRIA